MIENLTEFILGFFSSLGYSEVLFLMFIESSFVPFPSEIIIPPAAYLAAQGELNVYIVFVCGVVGSLLGSSLNYLLAFKLGRPIVYVLVEKKIARFFLLSRGGVERAEKYFLEHGKSATFFGRLIPAIRQLISIPAGFSRMNYWQFLFYTLLGSGIWVFILTALGYFIGANSALLLIYLKQIFVASVLIGFAFLSYLVVRLRK